MNNRGNPMERPETQPNVHIVSDDGNEHLIFALNDGESLRNIGVRDTSPRSHFYGPSIVVRNYGGGMCNTVEYDVNAASVWAWLARLLATPGMTFKLGPCQPVEADLKWHVDHGHFKGAFTDESILAALTSR